MNNNYFIRNNIIKINCAVILCIFSFISITFADSQLKHNVKIPIYHINDIGYISAAEYARINNYEIQFYKNKKKINIKSISSYDITLSQNSSFIIINDKIYHLPVPVLYENNDFLIPINAFLNIMKNISQPMEFIDTSGEYLMMYTKDFNINNIDVINKTNGTIIQINSNTRFDSNIISGSVTRGGWLNLTIPGGIIDSAQIVNSKKISPVERIRCLQYNESSQISFLINQTIDDFEITSDDYSIKINLRINTEKNTEKIKKMREKWLLDTIIIDAGHGGKDPGAVGIGGLQEKTITLDVAKKLGKLLSQNLGVNVIYTRENDEFVPIKKRTKIANDSNGKLFISIHANSAKNSRGGSGFETYLLRPGKWDDAIEVVQRENDVIKFEKNKEQYKELADILSQITQTQYIKESEFFASEIQNNLDKVLTIKNRGVKQAGFYVLHGINMPSVLIELGFITNKKDVRLLNKSRYRQKMAEAIFRAVVAFKEKYEEPILNE